MSILATIPAFLLNNKYALNSILEHGVESYLYASQEKLYKKWRNWVYQAFYARDASRPEHVFEERWNMFRQKDKNSGHSLLSHALAFLGEAYLHRVHGQLHIKTYKQFERWQNLHARMTLLPVIEYMRSSSDDTVEEESAQFPPALILYPYNGRLEDYIRIHGLNENHLHVNLCISAEEVWLVTLYHTVSYNQLLKEDEEKIESMLRQLNQQLTIHEHIARMRLAATLRQFILDILVPNGTPTHDLDALIRCYHHPDLADSEKLPMRESIEIPRDPEELLAQERLIWRKFRRWNESDNEYYTLVSTALHIYLLIMNEFVCLARYRDNQIGLQEFCRTSGYPRNMDDQTLYAQAFRSCAAHTARHGNNKIEVRFTPTSDLSGKCCKIINGAYHAAGWDQNISNHISLSALLQSRKLPYELILVGHLIKRVGKKLENASQSRQIREARERYLREIGGLIKWHKQGKHKHIPIGLDIAGAEIVLPVDAFVAAYKAYSMYSPHSRTFHCGEDFRHLITGMRAVYDVIHLLDFTPGNRVGHAVALGISPDIWLDSMPGKVVMTRREWLLDLIFCRTMFLRYGLPESDVLFRIEEELAGCSAYVFEEGINLHTLSSLYEARKLIPEMADEYLWQKRQKGKPEESGIPFDMAQKELQLLQDFEQQHGLFPLKLFQRWNKDETLQARLDERIEIPSDFLSVRNLTSLQQHMQRFVKERGIVIESLPISNYRIAPYKQMKHLHTLRWLHVDGCWIEGDTEMDICLGSDDPGIFASDIKAEYYHLFCMMKEYGLSDADAVSKLAEVNETGQIYSFEAIKTGGNIKEE